MFSFLNKSNIEKGKFRYIHISEINFHKFTIQEKPRKDAPKYIYIHIVLIKIFNGNCVRKYIY